MTRKRAKTRRFLRGGFVAVLSLGCLVLSGCRKPRRSADAIVIGETVTVISRHLNKEMIIDVRLPDGYERTNERYPVLVACQSHFLHVSGIAADLALKNSAPELIVAGVRNYSSGDFIPEKIEGHPDSGGADRFIAFFRDELLPTLDSRFRTHPFRIFYSGSFGGGFAVYMCLTQPSVFNACLAATPAIDFEGRSSFIMEHARSTLAGNSHRGRFLYLGPGNEPELIPVLEEFVEILKGAEGNGLTWEYRPFLDEDHGSVPNRVIYAGLKRVFAEWNTLPDEIIDAGVGMVRSYALSLREKFGYDIGLSRPAVAMAANVYRKQGRRTDVVDVLKLGLEYEPDSEMAWLQLGRALQSDGRLMEAREALETARRKAFRNSSPHLGIFIDALSEIDRRLGRE